MTPDGMNCRKCGKPMYREDVPGLEDWGEAWHCPDRLDGKHGEWHSMPVFVTRISTEEYERICEQFGINGGEGE